jgi:hypothetical protein
MRGYLVDWKSWKSGKVLGRREPVLDLVIIGWEEEIDREGCSKEAGLEIGRIRSKEEVVVIGEGFEGIAARVGM